MKKFTMVFCSLLTLLILSITTTAQNFTVTSPSTDPYQKLCKPIKAGGSFQMQIKVKSNIKDTLTISIDKFLSFGTWVDWFTIDVNSYTIVKDQTVVFQITVNVPAGTDENKYYFVPYFNARKGTSNSSPFQGGDFNVIVDNTPPVTPSVNISGKTHNSIAINFNSTDARSIEYTKANGDAGVDGIKSYTLLLSGPNGYTKTLSKDAKGISYYYTFNSLSGYTEYNAFVTAVDVAGNSKTSSGLAARTKVAAPANITVPNIGHCNATLSWGAVNGANSYRVSTSADGTNPITVTSPSLPVTGLTAGTRYTYYLSAVGAEGEGPRVSYSFSTLAVPSPIISGPSIICSSSSATFEVSNQPSACSVLWQSNNLSPLSVSGNPVTLAANGYGLGTVTATLNSGCGSTYSSFPISVGSPLRPYINNGSVTSTTSSVSYSLTLGQPTSSLQLFYITQPNTASVGNWIVEKDPSSTSFNLVENDNFVYVTPNNVGTGSFTVKGENECGESTSTTVFITVSSSGGGKIDPPILPLDFMLSPNPASDQVTVNLQGGESSSAAYSSSVEKAYEVQLWSSTNLIKTLKTNDQRVPFSLNALPTGTYYIKVIHNGNVKSKMFFKR